MAFFSGEYFIKLNFMARKENKGGLLSNEQIERDLEARGKTDHEIGYSGSQDTGDEKVRQMGNEVQKRDGLPDDNKKEE
jgi:hypothetical protein